MFQEITLINYRRPLKDRARARGFVGPYKWTPSQPGKGRGFYQSSKGLFMDSHGSSIDLRIEEANDHLSGSRLSHTTGYFCNRDSEGETLQPIIARLPRSRGFLAGWTMGQGMCASLDATIYEDIESAARAAHSMAEYNAEKSREDQERDFFDEANEFDETEDDE